MQIVSFVLAIVYCQANYSSIGICTMNEMITMILFMDCM